jgi:predicted MFS family arabinose efflux permease
LPQAATVVGTGVCAVLISMAAVRGNRRTAVRAAYGTAALGCLAVTVAAPISGSVVGVLAGSAMLGGGQAGVNLSRYWAPGSVPEHQALAIGRVMTWTTLGAIAGTSLLGPLDAVWSAFLPPLVGSYASALLALVAAWCVLPHLPGASTADSSDHSSSRPPVGPLLMLGASNGAMVLVMTMAPLQMTSMGASLGTVGLVLGGHVLGMFAPAALVGRLCDHWGARTIARVSSGMLAAACGICWLGEQRLDLLGVGLVLVGVGWNGSTVSGSTLLVQHASARDRSRHEASGEVVAGAAAALSGVASGLVMDAAGYPWVLAMGAALAAPVALASWLPTSNAHAPHSASSTPLPGGARPSPSVRTSERQP